MVGVRSVGDSGSVEPHRGNNMAKIDYKQNYTNLKWKAITAVNNVFIF